MKKILIAGLTVLLVSGCSNLEFRDGSAFGALLTSSNPDDYKSKFKSPASIDSYDKSDSIYGLRVGDKFTQEKDFELIGSINGSKIYKAKKNYKLGKGPIKDKISSFFVGVHPTTEIIRNINVHYGDSDSLDGRWVEEQIREFFTGEADGKFYSGADDPFVKSYRMHVYNYNKCMNRVENKGWLEPSMELHLKNQLLLDCQYDKFPRNYRLENGLIYGYGINMLFVGERPYYFGLGRMVDYISSLSSFSYPRHATPTKKRQVDNNGNVTYITTYHVPTLTNYNLGMGLEGVLWTAKTETIKGKESLKEFTIKLKDINIKPSKNGYAEKILYKAPHRLMHTYNDARDYYSVALPKLLKDELGCEIESPILPLKMDETEKFDRSFVCKVKGKNIEIKIKESKGDYDYKLEGDIVVSLI